MLETMYQLNSDILVTARSAEHQKSTVTSTTLKTSDIINTTNQKAHMKNQLQSSNNSSSKKKQQNTYQVSNRRRYSNNNNFNNSNPHHQSKKASIDAITTVTTKATTITTNATEEATILCNGSNAVGGGGGSSSSSHSETVVYVENQNSIEEITKIGEPKVMNNLKNKITVATATQTLPPKTNILPATKSVSTPSPPTASYSLNFLHSVGVQMTAGNNGVVAAAPKDNEQVITIITSPPPPPPIESPQKSNRTDLINNNNNTRRNQNFFSMNGYYPRPQSQNNSKDLDPQKISVIQTFSSPILSLNEVGGGGGGGYSNGSQKQLKNHHVYQQLPPPQLHRMHHPHGYSYNQQNINYQSQNFHIYNNNYNYRSNHQSQNQMKKNWNPNFQKYKKNSNNNIPEVENKNTNIAAATTPASTQGSSLITISDNCVSSAEKTNVQTYSSSSSSSTSPPPPSTTQPPRDSKSESPSLLLSIGAPTQSISPTNLSVESILVSPNHLSTSNNIETRSNASSNGTTNSYNNLQVEYDSDSSHSSNKYRNSEHSFRPTSSTNNGGGGVAGVHFHPLSDLQSSITNRSSYDDIYVRSGGGHYEYGSHQNLSVYSNGFLSNQNYSTPNFFVNFTSTAAPGGRSGSNCHYDHHSGSQKKSYSGRNSPQPQQINGCINTTNSINKTNTSGRNGTRNSNKTASTHSNNQTHVNHQHQNTPPIRFLNRSHLIEAKVRPDTLTDGSQWDTLSTMIWERFVAAQQSEATYKKKMYLWHYLYLWLKKTYPCYGLYLVGSTISGFGSDTSDVDMCLVSNYSTILDARTEALMHLTHLQDHLTTKMGIFEQFNLIQAKVPILRFRDSFHLLEVDLNYNNSVGVRNTHLLYCYSQMDWRLRPLALIVKLWAQFHNINNAKDMTISSYSLVLMTIHFLQYAVSPPVLPCLHKLYPEKFQKYNDIASIDMNEELEPCFSTNQQSLGELFLNFLEYYSIFDYAQYAISVRTATVLPIEECRQARSPKNDIHQWKELCIEEPFDLTNTARSVYDCVIFDCIKQVIFRSCRQLHETMDLSSIFQVPFMSPSTTFPLSTIPIHNGSNAVTSDTCNTNSSAISNSHNLS